MPNPSTPLLDDFNRANETPLAPSPVWSNQNLNRQLNQCLVVSNQMAPDTAASRSRCTSIEFPPDVEFWVTVPVFTTTIDLAYRGRSVASSNWNGYLFENTGGSWQFYRVTAGSVTTVGATFGSAVVNNDQLMVRAYANTHELWKLVTDTWTLQGTRTDGTYVQTGRVELGFGPNTTGRFDNFGGGAIATSPYPLATSARIGFTN